jgi:nitrite reductase/ring-hydroxylating ferredoxin subunit
MSEPVSRRDVLRVAGQAALAVAGVAALAGVGRYLAFDANPPARARFTLDLPEAYPVGSVTQVPAARAWLVRDPRGIFALSGICTHLGCTVRQAPEGFECPCHGSRFAPDGQVLSGQARKPLPRFLVGLDDDGRLWIDVSREVDADFRL